MSDINYNTTVLYNDPVDYDVAYLTYNGYSIKDQIIWTDATLTSTSWSDL